MAKASAVTQVNLLGPRYCKLGAVNLHMLVKLETGRVATSKDSGRAPRGGRARRTGTNNTACWIPRQHLSRRY